VKNNILRKILSASGLTRQGKLIEATEAIQRALSSAAKAGAHMSDAAPASAATNEAEPVVLDGLVRVAEQPATTVEAERPLVDRPGADVARPADLPRADAAEPSAPVRPGPARFLSSSFTGAAGTRAITLFVPTGFDGRPLPLAVMLHGCTQDPDDFALGTRMNELAQQQGLFVLYPAQAARSNAHKCWNWFAPGDQRRGAGEPALLAGMVRHVLQTHPVDPDRVYVAGLSAGGAMAAILAREYPDVFAAAGVHSGLPPGAAHDVASAFAAMKSGPAAATPRRRASSRQHAPAATATQATAPRADAASTPIIVFHGDADGTVMAANGDAVIRAALAGHANAVAEAIPCAAAGRRDARRTVWRAAEAAPDAPTLAEQWVVRGAPHAWSGGAAAGSYTDPQGPDASREMLRFFLAHPRRHG
jgi:poly(hydroxyalkanoate) depolymerase family esterase